MQAVVRSESDQLAIEVRRLLMPFITTRPPLQAVDMSAVILDGDGSQGYGLVVDDREVLRGTSKGEVVGRLLTELNRRALDRTSAYAVHAGAVARGGRVAAFPGASGAGKTTLTAACLLAGFSYVSDEALCIDYDRGLVAPYAKPLMLSPSSCRMLGLPAGGDDTDEVALRASELGAESADPGVLSDIILLERTADVPELVTLPAADGMAALLRYSFNHFRRPQDAFLLAGDLARSCTTHRLRFGDPLAAAALLWESQIGRPAPR